METIDYFRPTHKWFKYSKENSAQHTENFEKILSKFWTNFKKFFEISQLAYSFEINFPNHYVSGKNFVEASAFTSENSKIKFCGGTCPPCLPPRTAYVHIDPKNIGGMDETPVFADMPGNTTVDQIGQQTVPIVTTGSSLFINLFDL